MANMSSWMARVPDATSLSAMSIPGTHDTGTYTYDLVAKGTIEPTLDRIRKFVQCQAKSIREQLDAGVRFLDLRIKDGPGFPLYHDVVPLGISLQSAMDEVDAFLKANQSETVLVCVKKEVNEGRPETSAELKAWFDKRPPTRKNAKGESEGIYMASTVPKLGEVRGRAVLINRVFETKDAGIFIWFEDNKLFSKSQKQGDGSQRTFAVQDCYDPSSGLLGSNLTEKKKLIREGYERYSKMHHDFRISFLSATSAPTRTPDEYASDINPRVFEFLRDWTGGAPWITIMDYVGQFGSGRTDPVAAVASANCLTKGGQPGTRDTLKSGESLAPGEALLSSNHSYRAILQSDGNFCVRRTVDDCPTHASKTDGKPVTRASMQDDGNFVIYDGDKALAWTGTNGRGKGRLTMQNDGNLVLYDDSNKAHWASNFNPFHR